MRFEVISVLDPAIAVERMTLEQMIDYRKTRDTDLLKPFLHPGQQPTIYRCEEVRHELWESYVMAGSTDAEKARRAFQCGLKEVVNMVQADGRALGTWSPSAEGPYQVMPDEQVSRFSPQIREEIGYVIFHKSFFSPQIKLDCPLPLTLASVLGRLAFRHAEPSQSEPVQSSESHSSNASDSDPSESPQTAGDTTTRASQSVSATDATATATQTGAG